MVGIQCTYTKLKNFVTKMENKKISIFLGHIQRDIQIIYSFKLGTLQILFFNVTMLEIVTKVIYSRSFFKFIFSTFNYNLHFF